MKEPVRKTLYKRIVAGLLLVLLAVAPMASSLAAEYSTVINPYSNAKVNLRCAPDQNSKIIASYAVGTKVEILAHGTWMHVRINGISGYMHADFINLKGNTAPSKDTYLYVNTPNGNNLNLRAQPSHDAKILCSYAPGTQVKVMMKGSAWHKVEVNGLVGYMSATYLSSTKPSTPSKPSATETINKSGVVSNPKANQLLNLREKACLSAKILGQYKNGTKLYVYSRTGDWYKVQVGDKIGYMMTQYVMLAGSSNNAKFMTVINNNGGSFANLRDYAGMHYPILKEVKVGTKVEVLERGEYWTRVSAGNTVGYINNYFLK